MGFHHRNKEVRDAFNRMERKRKAEMRSALRSLEKRWGDLNSQQDLVDLYRERIEELMEN